MGDGAQVAGVRAHISVALTSSATSLATAVLTLEVLGSTRSTPACSKASASSRLDSRRPRRAAGLAERDLLIHAQRPRRGTAGARASSLRHDPLPRCGIIESTGFGKAVGFLAPGSGDPDLRLAVAGSSFGARFGHCDYRARQRTRSTCTACRARPGARASCSRPTTTPCSADGSELRGPRRRRGWC